MKERRDNILIWLNFTLIICMALFCLLGIFLIFSGDIDNMTGGVIIICMSFPILIAIILLTLCNIRTGLRVYDKGIEIKCAFFKTYFFKYDEIKDVIPIKIAAGWWNTVALNIYLKSGKQLYLGPISNLYEKMECIQKNISTGEDSLFNYEEYQKKEKELHKRTKPIILFTICLWLLFFVELVLTILLTGGRAIVEYTPTDRVIFTCYCILSVLTYIIAFIMTIKAYKFSGWVKPYISLLLRKEVYETTLLEKKEDFPDNLVNNSDITHQNMVGAYTSETYLCRTTVFRTTADNSQYFFIHEKFSVRKGRVKTRICQGIQEEGIIVKQAIESMYRFNGDRLIAIRKKQSTSNEQQ